MRAAAGRRRGRESAAPERARPPPPTPTSAFNDPWQHLPSATGRDSDASFASSRPSNSSIGINPRASSGIPINDKSYQYSAIRTINAYLASHSLPFSLKSNLPSAKDIIETLKFILSHLGFQSSLKFEDDFYVLLKSLNCPIKLNKSALRAPSTPHTWPSLLGVMHWLVQICLYNDHLISDSQARSFLADNGMTDYAINSYLFYIRGDDDSVEALDEEFMKKLREERDAMAENVKALEENVNQVEKKLEALKTGPSKKELLEKEKAVLEEDIKKFHTIIAQLESHIAAMEKGVVDKEKELEAKALENKRICEENEELKKQVEEQAINARDAERMKRELQAVDRDVAETEIARNEWEEKAWDLDSTIGHKFKELEALMIECNQAIRRLKLGNGFQYQLNAKGSTSAEVLGIDYKTTLKPALASFSEEIKRTSVVKLEELISLQKQAAESSAKIEAKRNHIAALESHIDEVEAQLNLIRKETQDYTSGCAAEARKMVEEVEAEAHNLEIVEREAAEYLKASKAKLQEAVMQSEEEVQLCARELFAVVDSLSKYKEYAASKIAEMRNDLLETATAVANIHRGSLPAQVSITSDESH